MKKGTFVLKNSKGEVIRSLHGSQSQIKVIQRLDSGRVEIHSELKSLKDKNIEFNILAEATTVQIKKTPLKIGHLILSFNDENIQVIKDIPLRTETDEKFKGVLRWTAIVHMVTLAICLIAALVIKKTSTPEEKIVTVSLQKRTPLNIRTRPPVKTVQAAKKVTKRTHRRQVKKKLVRKVKVAKNSQSKTLQKRNRLQKKSQVKDMGVLGALGGFKNGRKGSSGSLKLSRVKGSSGNGSGFKSKTGGSALKGAGLISGRPGRGTKIGSTGHFKTRGEGGGQRGYGDMSLQGSHSSYLNPLQEEAIIEGGLSRDQIASVIQRNLGQVLYCYERGLQREPQLKGKVAVQFIISSSGRVQTAKVHRTSLDSTSVEGCIVKQLRSWKFPKPYGNVNVNVTYPFVLKRFSSRG